ncbi:MAG: 3-keto-disaccharide hydrolase [Pyrinomonadaceae bacterium]
MIKSMSGFRLAFSLFAACMTFAVFANRLTQEQHFNEQAGPEPKVVDPGRIGGPPSDAIILFDGKDLSKWIGKDGGEAKWEVKNGAATVNGTGDITTRQAFGDMQLHVEWATPAKVKGEGQERGNSGIYLEGLYEVQVLDSFNSKTYVNGQAGSIYKQYAPLANASRLPGEWQTYDIIFHASAFDEKGKVTKKARVTVIHNGVLVQDNVEIMGNTSFDQPPLYTAHAPQMPLTLQDHHNPVRYRNIWVRPLSQ